MTFKGFFRTMIASTHQAPRCGRTAREIDFAGMTPLAATAMRIAQEEAQHREQRYIGTEHILVGLLSLDEGSAGPLLRAFGLRLDAVRRQLALETQPEPNIVPTIWLSNRSLKAIEKARSQAATRKCADIKSGDLLFALLEADGLATKILSGRNIQPALVRTAVKAILENDYSGENNGSNNG